MKVTVDAYEGTVTFYVFDEKDPIIRAWRKAFPDLFTTSREMSDELHEHLRYPEDLFKVQSNMFGRYHVHRAAALLRRQRQVAGLARPGLGIVGAEHAHHVRRPRRVDDTATNEPQEATSTGRRVDPYYLYLKLPGDDDESFVILEPFVPVSSGNSSTRLVSFLTANSDPEPVRRSSSRS